MKFGGTSVRDARRLQRAVSIVDERRAGGAVVVVSAAAGVTRALLELGNVAASGDAEAAADAVARLRARQLGIVSDLGLAEKDAAALAGRLDALLAQLEDLVQRMVRDGDGSPPMQDAVMSFGERLSSTQMAATARQRGLPVEPVDAREVIITDASFRAARPDLGAISARAAAALAPALAAGRVVVIEGFIGATPDGRTTTMGFEASDLSAALLGAALAAREVQIWTDVPGMLSTGHPAVTRPRLVPRLSYDEAAELALFGAKVLHPDTVAPARSRGIPVRILHAANPAGVGTWIGDGDGPDAGAPDGATPAGTAGYDGDVAPPTVKAIAVTEDPADESFAGVRDTLRLQHPEGWNGRAIVCPVGRGIGSAPQIIERVRVALQEVPGSMPLGERPDAVPVAVPRRHLAEAVLRLHDALIPSPARLPGHS